MRHLKILATLTCTATAAVVGIKRIGRPLLSLAARQQRELEGRPLMEAIDDE